ncbi:hypothetical protein VP01_3031g2 [Puccinia sorghi]|uniref:Reverse transcriptase Ty1/copia-type domain-containing protein n=1 Tax=Puccinia sorghi TaxID=27349 RepID=A0A0L6V054_9BASI|nr:hypothetical protein VP01_3031g2 [Puccinia sorghi]
MSSTESEMNALSDGEQENQWLSFLIEELWKLDLPPTLFHIDNKGLLEKLKNFGSNSKTKHLDIKIKALREKFKKKEIDHMMMMKLKVQPLRVAPPQVLWFISTVKINLFSSQFRQEL